LLSARILVQASEKANLEARKHRKVIDKDFSSTPWQEGQLAIHNSAAQQELSQTCLNYALQARNLDTKFHNSQLKDYVNSAVL